MIEWPTKEELKDVGLIILGIICAVQCGVIALGVSVIGDLRDTAQECRRANDECVTDYNDLRNLCTYRPIAIEEDS